MKIEKVINNNIISTFDHDGTELIVMGRGLGFGKKTGQEADEGRVEKVFRMDSEKEMEDFKNLVTRLPIEYLRLTDQIISYTKDIVGLDLNQNIYLTLTDHISFAVDRFLKGMNFPNTLFEEIRMFYPKEFLVGKKSLELIEKYIHVKLPEDEAASIALHLVNAEYHGTVGNALQMTTMIKEIVDFIDDEYRFHPILTGTENLEDLSESSIHKNWMISNIKYLVHRLLKLEAKDINVDQFTGFIEQNCDREYQLVCRINRFLNEKYGCNMTKEEIFYFSIIIYRAKKIAGYGD